PQPLILQSYTSTTSWETKATSPASISGGTGSETRASMARDGSHHLNPLRSKCPSPPASGSSICCLDKVPSRYQSNSFHTPLGTTLTTKLFHTPGAILQRHFSSFAV